jgi:hypothetical protein
MNYAPLVGLASFCIMIIVSGKVIRKGITTLSADEKVRLVDNASARRSYAFLLVPALLVGWYVISQRYAEHRVTAYIVLLGILLGFAVLALGLAHRRMNRLGLPKTFQRSMLTASILRVGGLFVLAIYVLWPLFWNSR